MIINKSALIFKEYIYLKINSAYVVLDELIKYIKSLEKIVIANVPFVHKTLTPNIY